MILNGNTKRRRNNQESDLVVAIREFEETNIKSSQYKLIDTISPIRERFVEQIILNTIIFIILRCAMII